jgi:hypothetical protein
VCLRNFRWGCQNTCQHILRLCSLLVWHELPLCVCLFCLSACLSVSLYACLYRLGMILRPPSLCRFFFACFYYWKGELSEQLRRGKASHHAAFSARYNFEITPLKLAALVFFYYLARASISSHASWSTTHFERCSSSSSSSSSSNSIDIGTSFQARPCLMRWEVTRTWIEISYIHTYMHIDA